MDDRTSMLFGLDAYRVVDVVPVDDSAVQVVVETVEGQGIWPDCGRASVRVHDRPLVRWLKEAAGWRRSDPWLASFVDADTGRSGLLLGLAPGRSGGRVRGWPAEQIPHFRAGVHTAVIDPSGPYASGIRIALPRARIAVDHWHLVRLANGMVTEVLQRVTPRPAPPPRPGHRPYVGTPADAADRRCPAVGKVAGPTAARASRRRPTDQIGVAWGCRELLRQVLAESNPPRNRARLW